MVPVLGVMGFDMRSLRRIDELKAENVSSAEKTNSGVPATRSLADTILADLVVDPDETVDAIALSDFDESEGGEPTLEDFAAHWHENRSESKASSGATGRIADQSSDETRMPQTVELGLLASILQAGILGGVFSLILGLAVVGIGRWLSLIDGLPALLIGTSVYLLGGVLLAGGTVALIGGVIGGKWMPTDAALKVGIRPRKFSKKVSRF